MNGRQGRVDADRIFAEALALLDTKGIGGFTLAALARRLGIAGPSLYEHVANKAEIIEGVRDLVVGRIDYTAFATAPWDIALKAWARSYLSAFAAHPNTIELLATAPVTARAQIDQYDAAVSALLRGGWPELEVMHVVTSVESLVLGTALVVVAPSDVVITHTPAHPLVAAALLAQNEQPGRALATFELGLEALVAGFRLRLAAQLQSS